jgi:hypothetical protein
MIFYWRGLGFHCRQFPRLPTWAAATWELRSCRGPGQRAARDRGGDVRSGDLSVEFGSRTTIAMSASNAITRRFRKPLAPATHLRGRRDLASVRLHYPAGRPAVTEPTFWELDLVDAVCPATSRRTHPSLSRRPHRRRPTRTLRRRDYLDPLRSMGPRDRSTRLPHSVSTPRHASHVTRELAAADSSIRLARVE